MRYPTPAAVSVTTTPASESSSDERREWLEKIGIGGKLDVTGRIFLKDPPANSQAIANARALTRARP